MKHQNIRNLAFSVLALALFTVSCKVNRITQVHHHHYGTEVVENPAPRVQPDNQTVPDPVYYDEPVPQNTLPLTNTEDYVSNNIDVDDYDYYYSSRIRRFHNPYRGFNYYSNVYTDYYYYDPYYAGSTIYVVNDYWGPQRNWWHWNGPYSYVGVGWGWGAGWHSGWGGYWGPGQYYGWGCRPHWHGNHWGWGGWRNGYWNGYNNGYNNGYWAGYWDGYRDGHWDNWWRSSANPGSGPDRNVYNGRHDRSGGRLASNNESPNGLTPTDIRTNGSNVNVRPTANPSASNNTIANNDRNVRADQENNTTGSIRNNGNAANNTIPNGRNGNNPAITENPVRSNNSTIPNGRNGNNPERNVYNNPSPNNSVRNDDLYRQNPNRSNTNINSNNAGSGLDRNPNRQTETSRQPERQMNNSSTINRQQNAPEIRRTEPSQSRQTAPQMRSGNSSGNGFSSGNNNGRSSMGSGSGSMRSSAPSTGGQGSRGR